MPSKRALQVAIASNSAFSPSYLPVAVFFGGTAGIGQGTVEALARHTNGNVHIILVGRNRSAAESIIAGLPKPTIPDANSDIGAKYEFIECDVTSMKTIERVTKDISSRVYRINFLVLSVGFVEGLGREMTEEGMDKKLAAFYYGRWKIVNDLMPLLREASELGQAATVYSVLGAGREKKIEWDDLGLKKRYSLIRIRQQVTAYTDVIFQEFAIRNPSISFIHAWPGTVRTNLGRTAKSIFIRWFLKIMFTIGPLFRTIISYDESGEYMLFGMLTKGSRAGAWRVEQDGLEMTVKPYVATEAERRKLWEHTEEEVVGAMTRQ